MKINILLYHLDLGGVEKSAVELANELAKLNHSVTITTIYKNKVSMFDINKNVTIRKNLGFYFNGLDRILQKVSGKLLYKLFVKEKFDIEIAFQASLPTTVIANSNNRDSIKYAWIHGIGANISSLYKAFDKIVFVGNSIREHYIPMLEKENIPFDKTEVVYNTLNVEKIISESKNQAPEIESDDSFKIISVGRLSKEKNFTRLVEATKILIDKGYNVKTFLVGEGADRGIITSKVEELNLINNFHLLGYQSNPYKYITKADCYVCSSDYEGFNIAISEAAVLGKSIVSTDVYGAKELLGFNDEFGIICDLSSVDLAKSLEKLITDKNLRNRYESKIKDRIEDIIKSRFDLIQELFRNL